jgi:hypothetical protein
MLLPEGGRPYWDMDVNIDFVTSLLLLTTQEDSTDIRRQAGLVILTELALTLPTILAWIDGSASDGTQCGGAGIIVEFYGIMQILHGPAGEHTSSFWVECIAL